jgi:thiol-disulfide isomerase/thioredoxin
MNKALKRTLFGLGAVAALGAAAVGYFIYDQLHPDLPRNLSALSQVRLTNEAGSSLHFSEAVTPHSATLVAFWTTWCGPCHSEATKIAALRRQYRANDLSILYLNVDEVPSAAATAAFLRVSHAESLHVLYAGHSGWKTITGHSTMTLPRSYVFDRAGTASAVFAGFDKSDTGDEMQHSLTKAISG